MTTPIDPVDPAPRRGRPVSAAVGVTVVATAFLIGPTIPATAKSSKGHSGGSAAHEKDESKKNKGEERTVIACARRCGSVALRSGEGLRPSVSASRRQERFEWPRVR